MFKLDKELIDGGRSPVRALLETSLNNRLSVSRFLTHFKQDKLHVEFPEKLINLRIQKNVKHQAL